MIIVGAQNLGINDKIVIEYSGVTFKLQIDKITQTDGPDILRLKGILALKDDPERYVVQGVHMIVEGDHQRPWAPGEPRRSRLVFIGRNLDREKLTRTFAALAA